MRKQLFSALACLAGLCGGCQSNFSNSNVSPLPDAHANAASVELSPLSHATQPRSELSDEQIRDAFLLLAYGFSLPATSQELNEAVREAREESVTTYDKIETRVDEVVGELLEYKNCDECVGLTRQDVVPLAREIAQIPYSISLPTYALNKKLSSFFKEPLESYLSRADKNRDGRVTLEESVLTYRELLQTSR
ncbi:hypothetical protein D6817_01375 [Candidatus Pacearchaeota archaeon]|nr:MAG: hypothetical protein D6817_01375 [Candidatus Pacearchaeota archaeon]